MVIGNYMKEANGSLLEATVHSLDTGGYSVQYIINGIRSKKEIYENKTISEVETAVNNWLNGVKQLNG